MKDRRGSVWLEALLSATAIALCSLVIWLRFGSRMGLLACVFGCLVLLFFHLVHLARLLRWLNSPAGTPVPAAQGAWEDAFANLHRRTRHSSEEQRRLKTLVARFRSAGQALPDGVVVLDSNHIIEWFNPIAGKHLGLSLEQDRGYPITNLVREPEFVAHLDSGRYSEPLLLRPARNPGCSLALQIVPYGAKQKLLLSKDISQLEKLESLRRDFVANVSHELKTPLTVVNGFIETLLDGYAEFSAEVVERYLQLAREQSQRMQRLVDDLLTLSALETGPLALDESVPLAPLLQEILAEARALSGNAHSFTLSLADPVCLLGSRSELHSAISNLASNAVRYTPGGGKIAIAWHSEADGGGRLSVSDEGIGIEAQHLPRLTERFYRVDRGRSRQSGGTGLGLAIVKHILTRHQAQLEIVSQPGRGSCFSIRFPARRCLSSAA